MAGSFLRGALLEFTETLLVPTPNVIIFQYNPETITHTWTQPEAAKDANGKPVGGNPLAVTGMPGESFSFTLVMDANDQIAEGNPLAVSSGIYSRLAALEMLLYPTGGKGLAALLGQVSASLSSSTATIGVNLSSGGENTDVPAYVVPTVLFIWGPGRIVPVRVTELAINETIYDTLLNPTHAEAQIQLSVLTPDELAKIKGPLANVATAAYAYSQAQRQALAVLNLANAAEASIGMIPV